MKNTHNLIMAGQGVIHYGVVFMWRFQAKRYDLLDKRDAVPKVVQWQFIASVWLVVLGCLLGMVPCCFV